MLTRRSTRMTRTELFSLLHPDYEFVDHMGAVAEESGSGIETIRRQIERVD